MRWTRRFFLLASSLLIGMTLAAPGLAHPPWNPFDTTQFAPITQFGPSIGVKTVATGIIAPLKGVVAPGSRTGST
jgi:hypothetical protein